MDDKERERRFRAERRAQLRRSVLIQTDTLNEIVRWLNAARDEILARLAGTPTEFETWRLTQLQVTVRRALETFERGATSALTTGLDRSWSAGAELVSEALRAGGIDLSGQMPALDVRVLTALKSFQTDRIRDISTTTVNRVNQAIGQVAIGVDTPFAAAKTVAELLDTPVARARQIVRTELGTAYSEAGQQRMEQAVKLGVTGLQKMWRRSGKLHPRVTHDLADGQIVDVDKPFMVGGIPIPKPRDPSIPVGERVNCGCASLPHMRHWRVSTPGPKPYTAQELATSPAARQVEEVRSATPTLERALTPQRLAQLRDSLAATRWGQAQARGERLYGLSDDEALALHAYTFYREEGGARAVNEALRAGNADQSPYSDLIRRQMDGIEKLPVVSSKVTRFLSRLPSDLDGPDLSMPASDLTMVEKGFMSSTRDEAAVEPFFRGMKYELRIRSRTGRDLSALSTFPQQEVIFRPGTRMRVLATALLGDKGGVLNLEEIA